MNTGNRTALAQQALDASDVIHMTFAKRVVGKQPPRKLQVKVPDGPSTAGGKKARQSITLVPQSGEGGAVMCGWLDVASRRAELRTYPAVAAQYKERFRKSFDVTAGEYGELMKDLERTLYNLQVQVRHSDEGGSAARAGQAGSGPSPVLLAVIGIGVLLAIAVALVVWM